MSNAQRPTGENSNKWKAERGKYALLHLCTCALNFSILNWPFYRYGSPSRLEFFQEKLHGPQLFFSGRRYESDGPFPVPGGHEGREEIFPGHCFRCVPVPRLEFKDNPGLMDTGPDPFEGLPDLPEDVRKGKAKLFLHLSMIEHHRRARGS